MPLRSISEPKIVKDNVRVPINDKAPIIGRSTRVHEEWDHLMTEMGKIPKILKHLNKNYRSKKYQITSCTHYIIHRFMD